MFEGKKDEDEEVKAVLVVFEKLSTDLKQAAVTLSPDEVKYLVSMYYNFQDQRKRMMSQIRQLSSEGKPHDTLIWFAANSKLLEIETGKALKVYVDSTPEGVWLQSIDGVGPIISAGLIAHIRLHAKTSGLPILTAGQVWRFAGLDPTNIWEPSELRPWNADLKTLCWKVGESFVKVWKSETDLYGKLYNSKKQYYHERNDKGDYKERALGIAEEWKKKKKTKSLSYKAYCEGLLPDGHMHAMAKRFAVKIFLAHYLEAYYQIQTGKRWETEPYAIGILGHAHSIHMPAVQRHLLNSICEDIWA